MVTGKTQSGFEYSIDAQKVKSWTLARNIARIQRGANDGEVYLAIMDIVDELIGEEQERRLVDHITKEYGYDDVEIMCKEIFEIIALVQTADETKNSSSSPDVSRPTRKR